MSFNGSFSISQGTDATSFSLSDTSTGSDTQLSDRRIYLYLANGTTLTPPNSSTPYIDWPIASGPTIALTGILQQDYSINIVVNWISNAPLPSPSTYTAAILNTFTANLELFDYSLTQLQSANPLLVGDNRYFPNKSQLRIYIDNAVNSTTYNDQYQAQLNLNAGYKMQQNRQYLF